MGFRAKNILILYSIFTGQALLAQPYQETILKIDFRVDSGQSMQLNYQVEAPTNGETKTLVFFKDSSLLLRREVDTICILIKTLFPNLREIQMNASWAKLNKTISKHYFFNSDFEVFNYLYNQLNARYTCILMFGHDIAINSSHESLHPRVLDFSIINMGAGTVHMALGYYHLNGGSQERFPRDVDLHTRTMLYGLPVLKDSFRLKVNENCKSLFLIMTNSAPENYMIQYFDSIKKEYVSKDLYTALKSIHIKSDGKLEELEIEKPLPNVNIYFDSSVCSSLRRFTYKSVLNTELPADLYQCKNLNTLSINVLGFKPKTFNLDVFDSLQTLELFNCAKLDKQQQSDLLKSKSFARIRKLAITFPPNKDFLYQLLSKCKSLKVLVTDPNTLAMICSFEGDKAPVMQEKWFTLLKSIDTVSTFKNSSGSSLFMDVYNDHMHYIGNPCLIGDKIYVENNQLRQAKLFILQRDIAKYLEIYFCSNSSEDEYEKRLARILDFYKRKLSNFY